MAAGVGIASPAAKPVQSSPAATSILRTPGDPYAAMGVVPVQAGPGRTVHPPGVQADRVTRGSRIVRQPSSRRSPVQTAALMGPPCVVPAPWPAPSTGTSEMGAAATIRATISPSPDRRDSARRSTAGVPRRASPDRSAGWNTISNGGPSRAAPSATGSAPRSSTERRHRCAGSNATVSPPSRTMTASPTSPARWTLRGALAPWASAALDGSCRSWRTIVRPVRMSRAITSPGRTAPRTPAQTCPAYATSSALEPIGRPSEAPSSRSPAAIASLRTSSVRPSRTINRVPGQPSSGRRAGLRRRTSSGQPSPSRSAAPARATTRGTTREATSWSEPPAVRRTATEVRPVSASTASSATSPPSGTSQPDPAPGRPVATSSDRSSDQCPASRRKRATWIEPGRPGSGGDTTSRSGATPAIGGRTRATSTYGPTNGSGPASADAAAGAVCAAIAVAAAGT